jgi:general stress protein 26
MNTQDHLAQIEQARRLLKTVRHVAYATTNKDGTPHNSPLMFIYNDDLSKLYVGSYSESLHCKNLVRTGKAFAVVYDSFTKGQGGIYITGTNAHECEGEELIEALDVHNAIRAKHGSKPLEINYYRTDKPSQRMYSINVAKVEIYSVVRDENGFIASEARVAVAPRVLIEQ